jgi:hypothetical protein
MFDALEPNSIIGVTGGELAVQELFVGGCGE